MFRVFCNQIKQRKNARLALRLLCIIVGAILLKVLLPQVVLLILLAVTAIFVVGFTEFHG